MVEESETTPLDWRPLHCPDPNIPALESALDVFSIATGLEDKAVRPCVQQSGPPNLVLLFLTDPPN